MEIFDLPQKEHLSKEDIEILDKQKKQFKYLGSERKVPGHTMFSLNLKTGEIKAADIERAKDIHFKTKRPVTKGKIIIEPDCIYRQALNKKNFIKRLVREGILVMKRA